ncbi:phosphopantetheine-binding protein [Streptomyces puniciscabiei]
MDHQWIRSLLGGLMEDQTVQTLCDRYDEYKDVPLRQLGLESVGVMGLVLRMESEFGKEIDYEAFDLSDVSTLERAARYLGVD